MPSATYRVSIGNRVLSVTLRYEDATTYARVDDGPEREVDLVDVRGVLRTLVMDGTRAEVLAQRSAEGVHLTLGGIELFAEVQDEAHARLAALSSQSGAQRRGGALKAPMPGLVVRVLCAAGDVVEMGQPLVVLQAMKMENELALGQAGTVESVSVAAGQTVDQGQVLVTLQ